MPRAVARRASRSFFFSGQSACAFCAAAAAAAQKAQADWPEKKNDLDARLATARGILARSDDLWQSTTEARRAAAANDYSKVDFGTLFAAADTLNTGAADLPKRAGP